MSVLPASRSSCSTSARGYCVLLLMMVGCTAGQDAADSVAQEQPTADERPMAQARGRLLLEQYDCGSCHLIPGVRRANGSLGPSLESFAHRAYLAGEVPNQPRLLAQWIQHPSSLVPGTLMPDQRMPPAHASDMGAYLMGLR